MRRSLLILTLGFLLTALQPALACAGCAPAHDCCPPGQPMPCGPHDGGQSGDAGEARVCCSSAPLDPVAIASSPKPGADADRGPGIDGLDAVAALAAITYRYRLHPIAFAAGSFAIAAAWGAETYLLTRRLRL